MTSAQETALTYGSLAFAVVWGVLLVPQLISHYARFGRVHGRRVVTTAVVTLYSCLAVAVVLLPLPAPGDARFDADGAADTVPVDRRCGHGTGRTRPVLRARPVHPGLPTTGDEHVAVRPVGDVRGVVATARRPVRDPDRSCDVTAGGGHPTHGEFRHRTVRLPHLDVDDLLANTAGAALGGTAAVLFLALRRLKRTNAAIREAGTRDGATGGGSRLAQSHQVLPPWRSRRRASR